MKGIDFDFYVYFFQQPYNFSTEVKSQYKQIYFSQDNKSVIQNKLV